MFFLLFFLCAFAAFVVLVVHVRCLLFVCLLFGVRCCSLFDVRCLLFVVCCLSCFVVGGRLLIAVLLLFVGVCGSL